MLYYTYKAKALWA